ncbi:hypothetical protein BU15DRAFT_89701 [Melanogaster broomeanus]|nr:hypothetical protein BU15DRAFT_89701 [Melanogaster broomeanus]
MILEISFTDYRHVRSVQFSRWQPSRRRNTPRVRSLVHRGFLTATAFPNLPLILATTDVRTPKVSQMNGQHRVEAVYWTAKPKNSSPNYQGPYPSLSGRVVDELATEGFDWENKRLEVFDSMSGHMKATWCRPVPGTPLEGGEDEMKKWPVTLPKLGEAETEGRGEESGNCAREFRACRLGSYIIITNASLHNVSTFPKRRTTGFLSVSLIWGD